MPTVGQAAALDLVSAGDAVAAQWQHEPQQAVVLVHELAAGGEFYVVLGRALASVDLD
ncbi:hypothetical protein [Streptomyces sp. AcH 505]|uniref:hypothetical protein n=1 Tax=Streptomyces sp. AcH 505 TaxID=352211 RepID=UPI0012FF1FC8